MQEHNPSGNVVHSQNLAVLTAAATLGTEVILRTIGSEHSAGTLEGEFLTEDTITDALIARINKFLG